MRRHGLLRLSKSEEYEDRKVLKKFEEAKEGRVTDGDSARAEYGSSAAKHVCFFSKTFTSHTSFIVAASSHACRPRFILPSSPPAEEAAPSLSEKPSIRGSAYIIYMNQVSVQTNYATPITIESHDHATPTNQTLNANSWPHVNTPLT